MSETSSRSSHQHHGLFSPLRHRHCHHRHVFRHYPQQRLLSLHTSSIPAVKSARVGLVPPRRVTGPRRRAPRDVRRDHRAGAAHRPRRQRPGGRADRARLCSVPAAGLPRPLHSRKQPATALCVACPKGRWTTQDVCCSSRYNTQLFPAFVYASTVSSGD